MKVLVACEFSGIVRDAFAEKGHDAWSCDLLPTERPGNHIQGDIRKYLECNTAWDLLIAHPPCTRLSNSGVRWLHERDLWEEMRKAACFFWWLLYSKIPKKCIENPIPHKYALEIIGKKYNQIIQPWQFGHGETKATCLWLINLPPLITTLVAPEREQVMWKMSPGANRGKNRSRTYSGIAKAMAEQWG